MKVFTFLWLFVFCNACAYENCNQRGSDLCCIDDENIINCHLNSSNESNFVWDASDLSAKVKEIIVWINYDNIDNNDVSVTIVGRKDQKVVINEVLDTDQIESVHLTVEVKNFSVVSYNGFNCQIQKNDFAEEYEYERKFIFDSIGKIDFKRTDSRYMSSWTSFTLKNKKCLRLQKFWPDLEELVFEESYIKKLEPDRVNLQNVERISFKNCTIEWFYNDDDFKRKAVFEGSSIEKIFGYSLDVFEPVTKELTDNYDDKFSPDIEKVQMQQDSLTAISIFSIIFCVGFILLILLILLLVKLNQKGSMELNMDFQVVPEDVEKIDATKNESITYDFATVVVENAEQN